MRGMRLLISGLAVFFLASCADETKSPAEPETGPADLAPLYLAEFGKGVPDRFMVILHDDSSPQELASAHSLSPAIQYNRLMKGFASKLTPEQVLTLRGDDRVQYIEQDQIVRASTVQSVPATGAWGLDRIDQRDRGLSGAYSYNSQGTGVSVYVLDSGIDTDHGQFVSGGVNRIKLAAFFESVGEDGEDCHGHGTHVAGTIAGKTFGVAKNADIYSIRVLDCDGDGFFSDVVLALDWVADNAELPAVVNMSLGGPLSKSANLAVDRLSKDVLVVVSAGNENANACNVSPAGALKAVAVAASDSTDARADFSNWGRCVALYAPGVDILSARNGGGSVRFNGTSMASPHVAGVAALYLQLNPSHSPAQARKWILNNASNRKVRDNDPTGSHYGTPNKLLFKSTL